MGHSRDLPAQSFIPMKCFCLLPLHDHTVFHSHPFSLPFCLPHSDCYFNKCLSGTVKLKVEQKLEQIGKVQGVWLHTAHVLCMDAILSVGLEMGSHNPDCWPHVFRCMMGSPPVDVISPALGSLGVATGGRLRSRPVLN